MSNPKPNRDLCIMACIFCREPLFREWLKQLGPAETRVDFTEDMAKSFITDACGIASRNELDKDPAAAEKFHQLVRVPYLAWKEAQDEADY